MHLEAMGTLLEQGPRVIGNSGFGARGPQMVAAVA
jgi:hypothetical protein